MGPTASGKTAAAMQLVDQLTHKTAMSLISVDSALIYRQMDIGTAKPTPLELQHYPHQLIDIRNPQDSYSAADFVQDATLHIEQAHADNQLPVLIGGTMLYFKALLQGLSSLPTSDLQIRETIQTKIAEEGLTAAYAWLHQVDPVTAQRLHPNDQQRIERALEIYLSSGQPMSAEYKTDYFHTGWDEISLAQSPWRILPIALAPPEKSKLHPVIEQRFDLMVEQGLLDEVRHLMSMDGMHADLPSMRCVGYRQAWSYLSGEISFDEFKAKGKAATRQLAKRQMTWLRNWSTLTWIDPFAKDHHQILLSNVKSFLQG